MERRDRREYRLPNTFYFQLFSTQDSRPMTIYTSTGKIAISFYFMSWFNFLNGRLITNYKLVEMMAWMKGVLSVLLLVSIWVLSGCAPIYQHSSANTPMLEEQGDSKVSLRAGFSGAELQGAYALSDRFFLYGGLMGSQEEREDELEPSKHRYFELGAGTMWRPISNMVLEGSGGLGLGSGVGTSRYRFGDSQRNIHSEGGYIKPFIQGNVAFQSRLLDIGFVNRLAIIQYDEIRELGSNPDVISDPSTPLFWEPSVFMQLGWDRIKLNMNVGASSSIAGEPDFQHSLMNISFGVSYQFNAR